MKSLFYRFRIIMRQVNICVRPVLLLTAADRAGVEVRLKDVQTDLGWEIFFFPFYKGYKCIGEVTGPLKR